MTSNTNTTKANTMTQQTQTNELIIERTFNATPERLWSYWTEPTKYAKWLNPAPIDLVIHEWDLRVGGKVRFDMPQPDGNRNPQEGVFHELSPYTRLVSGDADKTFLLVAEFQPVGPNRTHLKVTATGVPPEWHSAATVGWNTGLDKLEKFLAGKEAAAAATPSGSVGAIKGISPPAVGSVKGRMVHLDRWFKAPPERVFGAWGNAELLPKFFWPVGTGKVTSLEFRKGGHLKMAHATEPWTAHWEILDVVPDRKIVIKDIWPDGSGNTATGTMEFTPENGGTRMKVEFGPFPTDGPFQPEAAVQGFAIVADRLAEETEVPGPGEGFRLIRFLQAPPEKVWQMWTTKEGLGKWWALSAKDMGYAFRVDQLDVRVGGKYDIVMSNKEHGELHNHGAYTEVVANKRLAQRWDFDIFLGPGEKPYPILVTVDLEALPPEAGGGTKMTFTQGPMAKPDFTEGSRQGVRSNLAKLEAALQPKA